jgi:hypothetical protein
VLMGIGNTTAQREEIDELVQETDDDGSTFRRDVGDRSQC